MCVMMDWDELGLIEIDGADVDDIGQEQGHEVDLERRFPFRTNVVDLQKWVRRVQRTNIRTAAGYLRVNWNL